MSTEEISIPPGCRIIVTPSNHEATPQALFASLPEVLDSKGAAEALGIPERTLRELARNGEVRGFKVGSIWRFTRKSLVEYVGQQEAILLKGTDNE